jgi:hypothetical protein
MKSAVFERQREQIWDQGIPLDSLAEVDKHRSGMSAEGEGKSM